MSDITRTLCEYTYAHINKIPMLDATLVEARQTLSELHDILPNARLPSTRDVMEQRMDAIQQTIYETKQTMGDEAKLQRERLAILEQYLGEGDSTP